MKFKAIRRPKVKIEKCRKIVRNSIIYLVNSKIYFEMKFQKLVKNWIELGFFFFW